MCVRRLCGTGWSSSMASRSLLMSSRASGRAPTSWWIQSNMGKIKDVHLDETWQALAKIYLELQALAEREVR